MSAVMSALGALYLPDLMHSPAPPRESASLYSLRLLGDPILTTPSVDVQSAEAIDRSLIDALRREMQTYRGVGMAAQQVGGLQRICVLSGRGASPEWRGHQGVTLFINPRIVARSEHSELHVGEGCLSVPGFRTSVRRRVWVDVEYRTHEFELTRERMTGFDAQVIQHECDHLDGHCIADGVSRQQRRQAERLVAEYRRDVARRERAS